MGSVRIGFPASTTYLSLMCVFSYHTSTYMHTHTSHIPHTHTTHHAHTIHTTHTTHIPHTADHMYIHMCTQTRALTHLHTHILYIFTRHHKHLCVHRHLQKLAGMYTPTHMHASYAHPSGMSRPVQTGTCPDLQSHKT